MSEEKKIHWNIFLFDLAPQQNKKWGANASHKLTHRHFLAEYHKWQVHRHKRLLSTKRCHKVLMMQKVRATHTENLESVMEFMRKEESCF